MQGEWIEFVETVVFTTRIRKLGLEESLRALQKDEQDSLTADQKRVLRGVVERIKGEAVVA
jgi:hypothetical protein